MKKLTFTALALMMCGAAWAAAIPQASRYDSRVQQVIYNPQNVTVVNTKPGFMTTLVFDNDEAVISAKPGFDEAWEKNKSGNCPTNLETVPFCTEYSNTVKAKEMFTTANE